MTVRRQYRRRKDVHGEARGYLIEFLLRGDCDIPRESEYAMRRLIEFPSDQELRSLWYQIGDRLLEHHITGNLGTRPWAWWQFEAVEMRRMIRKPETVGLAPSDYSPVPPNTYKYSTFFGMPYYFDVTGKCVVSTFHVNSADGERFESLFETEFDYLERLWLLTELELKGARSDVAFLAS